jgi:hypothetical protein
MIKKKDTCLVIGVRLAICKAPAIGGALYICEFHRIKRIPDSVPASVKPPPPALRDAWLVAPLLAKNAISFELKIPCSVPPLTKPLVEPKMKIGEN